MGTRSRVGILNKTGNTIDSIYIHWDGYIEGVGQFLLDELTNEEDIRKYISEGDRSSVNQSYKEWRDEDVPSINHPTKYWPDCGQEYEYYFAENTWYVRELYGKDTWLKLENELKKVLDK